ncbi:seven-hairpin glycosidase [Fistulina hepatica ATCC 64428]|uniref:alpha-1,2-Mannosidase n=1 Tax=Fistulina hepatica ATCC 64428 TaxID=1128425 RepID=A0A0D7AHQ4_9AGAR|nr:seven-hairpin glycosidase [Fistulina hepatica ATCC 64428]
MVYNDHDKYVAEKNWSARAMAVKRAMVHSWVNYRQRAYPADELLPIMGEGVNNFNGWGLTIYDALDTLWIMGLYEFFNDAVATVTNAVYYLEKTSYVPFFETVIRYLGGLLSAYSLSLEPALLERADDLGRALLPALNTESGFPMYAVNTVSGKTTRGWSKDVLWAEALSCQMEYKYLAHLTGNMVYYNKVEHIMEVMYNANITHGLFPTKWNVNTGKPTNKHYSVGAFADSAHEYMLKQWLLTGKTEPKTLELYLKATEGIINNLTYVTPHRKLLYITDIDKKPSHILEHLSCFLPGLLTLGTHTLTLPPRTRQVHDWVAQGLAYTCWVLYNEQPTGLAPDEVRMQHYADPIEGRWITHLEAWEAAGRPNGVPPGVAIVHDIPDDEVPEYSTMKSDYLLRPETIESFYYLWRTSGDEVWRERGWAIFVSIEKYAKTEMGYASVLKVNDPSRVKHKNEMPSYFLAETLKYLYLLFTDTELIPLKTWVFNTEGHPFPVFEGQFQNNNDTYPIQQ